MTPVTVGELSTEVTGEPRSPAAEPAAGPAPWRELDRLREAQAQLARDRARVHAEGLDA